MSLEYISADTQISKLTDSIEAMMESAQVTDSNKHGLADPEIAKQVDRLTRQLGQHACGSDRPINGS